MYPHSVKPIPHDSEARTYCEWCRNITPVGQCEAHPDKPHPVYPYHPILVGDIIETPVTIHRTLERFVVHAVTQLRDGSHSLRARPLGNPRAVDWHVFVRAAEPRLRTLSRGVARVDESPRTILPEPLTPALPPRRV